jgi:hypothetical protein
MMHHLNGFSQRITVLVITLIFLNACGGGGTLFVGLNGHIQMGSRWRAVAAMYSGNTDISSVVSEAFTVDRQIRSGSWAVGLKGQSL